MSYRRTYRNYFVNFSQNGNTIMHKLRTNKVLNERRIGMIHSFDNCIMCPPLPHGLNNDKSICNVFCNSKVENGHNTCMVKMITGILLDNEMQSTLSIELTNINFCIKREKKTFYMIIWISKIILLLHFA